MSITKWTTTKYTVTRARSEEGQGLVEYGLILSLIAIVCIGALTALQVGLSTTLGNITSSL